MKLTRALRIAILASFFSLPSFAADDYKPGPDSLPQPGVPKGEMLKDKYTAAEGSVFPGTEREYQIYLPAGLDISKPAPFMVFQDGVIYEAPVVFDNLIAKKEIPPLIGIFIKPGVVPAANDNALPRFNRSYEYDSVTDNYSRFLIDEFLPAIAAKHKLNLSADPNARGIAGSSSGGICAFMVAWHRPDSFRRVFTSVGTYVGIHGADQLPVLVRKYEPKPIRIYLQSGENDNNLYCGDWWMANQMMERSLTWNGYDVAHTWGTGGHNQKHATSIFPDVLRWLWKGYPDEPVKGNPRGDAKWRGYEVVGDSEWEFGMKSSAERLFSKRSGSVVGFGGKSGPFHTVGADDSKRIFLSNFVAHVAAAGPDELIVIGGWDMETSKLLVLEGGAEMKSDPGNGFYDYAAKSHSMCFDSQGHLFTAQKNCLTVFASVRDMRQLSTIYVTPEGSIGAPTDGYGMIIECIALSPDQRFLYSTVRGSPFVLSTQVSTEGKLGFSQRYFRVEEFAHLPAAALGLCVDSNGWLYVATSLGIQVCDQAGRVNFIIPTPQQPHDVCFGGKDLSELFIACGDTIYKRQTKAHGYISGQMAPIKPPPPKL